MNINKNGKCLIKQIKTCYSVTRASAIRNLVTPNSTSRSSNAASANLVNSIASSNFSFPTCRPPDGAIGVVALNGGGAEREERLSLYDGGGIIGGGIIGGGGAEREERLLLYEGGISCGVPLISTSVPWESSTGAAGKGAGANGAGGGRMSLSVSGAREGLGVASYPSGVISRPSLIALSISVAFHLAYTRFSSSSGCSSSASWNCVSISKNVAAA
mmetsp:Transcript_26207/g.31708  ORF Transcript_26207/g.31708 Transcript_26207/m.31708 type:complete len:216 (+) Transcript_26207:66-713(+)